METIDYRDFLLTMYKIRFFEEEAKRSYQRGLIRGPLHLYIGEEAVATGVCSALRQGDYITSTHRGHGHCLAKGADPKRMMAELYGREDGYCRGRGGSMHICDMQIGVLGADGIVGGGIPMALGAAFSNAYQKTNRVVACFFGDGASNQGAFHESLNLAALWKLPVLFVCESNGYAITTPSRESLPILHVADRAAGYGIEGVVADGMDVLDVRRAALKAVEKARNGLGPTLLECKTYRFEGHWYGDPVVYRTKDEVEQWRKRDPISRLRSDMKTMGLDEVELDEIASKAKNIISEAVTFATNSPEPKIETLEEGVTVECES
jgi:pyruvate dehydrogenase E1 component alpha subunit